MNPCGYRGSQIKESPSLLQYIELFEDFYFVNLGVLHQCQHVACNVSTVSVFSTPHSFTQAVP